MQIAPPLRADIGDLGRQRRTNDDQPNTPTQPYEAEIKRLFRTFIDFFQCTDERAELIGDGNGFYKKSLEMICQGGNIGGKALHNMDPQQSYSIASGFVVFPIRLSDIQSFGEALEKWIIQYPADCLVYADEEIRLMIEKDILRGAQAPFAGIRVAFYDHPHVCALRDLDPTCLERLVSIKGTVIRISQVIPEMQIAVFRCSAIASRNFERAICRYEVSEVVINGTVTEPQQCQRCQATRSFQLVHDKSVFSSKQLMKIQENPETIPEGETPQTVFVYMYDSLVDTARPGDRAIITGIFKAAPVRKNVRVRRIKSVFRTAIDVVHIAADSTDSNLQLDQKTTDEEEDLLQSAPQMMYHPSFVARARALADRPNIYEMLIDSFAPNIWEHTDVKKGLLCQLFGGSTEMTHSKRMRARGEIHVLLCGDPSTAKSQLLQYVHKIAPRGVYAVGRGTSAAGLTATVTRDSETKDFVLESGAVVLSDRGICCIDEFDKMDESTRAILHEVMEQQTVSLAKAGIVCSLNARTAILASANPVQSKYDTRKSVIENINLPSTLLSRFDLIYLILDTANEELDRKLAEHLCCLYTKDNQRSKIDPPLDREFISQYISYARRVCCPELSPESVEELVQTYLMLRSTGSGRAMTATPRQLDALVRLSKALAKMQLKSHVQTTHVKEAARLIRAATYQALVDPLTGKIDFEQLHHGLSAAQRARQTVLGNYILRCLEETDDSVSRETINTKVEEMLLADNHPTLQRRELERALDHFEQIRLIAKVQGTKYIKCPE